MFVGIYNRTVIITYIGVASAITGVGLAMDGQPKWAILCLLICGVCDMFDGSVARRCKRSEDAIQFGIEIDSLSDLFNFVMLPVMIFISLGMHSWYHYVIYIALSLTAVIRLATFNVMAAHMAENKLPIKYYTGLPVTTVSAIYPVFFLLRAVLDHATVNVILTCVAALVALLYVTKIKIPKATSMRAHLTLAALAVVVCVLVICVGE